MKTYKKLILITFILITMLPLLLLAMNDDKEKVSKINQNRVLAQATDDTCASGYVYNWHKRNVNSFTSFTTLPSFKVSSTSKTDKEFTYYAFHEASGCGKNYAGYCLHMGYSAPIGISNQTMSVINGFDSIVSTTNSPVDVSLLEDVIANGFQLDATNTKDISTISNENATRMLATQILVWEVVEGGRKREDGEVPSYHESDSAYQRAIIKDEGLHNAYKEVLENIKKANTKPTGSIFSGGPYTMHYDGTKYTTGSLSGLGDYSNCKVSEKSDSSATVNATINTNNKSITVTADKPVNATITCSYSVGSSSNIFRYFRFDKSGYCANRDCQDIVQGVAGKVYTDSFSVNTESGKVKIQKIGIDNNKLSGAKFTLTHAKNSNYKLTLDGNGNSVDINKSGIYYLREISAPFGYETITETSLEFNLSTHKVECVGTETKKVNNVTVCNGNIGITYSNDTFTLKIVDTAKNFKIKKVEGTKAVKGAGFKIVNSSGQTMKFRKIGDIYTYDANGDVETIIDQNASVYSVALLPKGTYDLVETSTQFPYILPTEESDRITKIQIDENSNLLLYNQTEKKYTLQPEATVTISNYTTKISIIKTGDGKPLEGVKFLLYDGSKNKQIRSTKTKDGIYEYNVDQSSGEDITYVTNNDGEIYVYYLPAGTYYFREIESVDNYVVPEGDSAFYEFTIAMGKTGQKVDDAKYLNRLNISNTKLSFNFYKMDEYGNYLTTGKFKLQKYNTEKNRYEDLKLVSVKNDGTYDSKADIFTVDNSKGKIQFQLTNGIATFIEMQPDTKYRIVETEAPEGYIKAEVSDSATVKIDKYGNASGLTTLINQKVVKEASEASAELIIELQTGQTRIKYAIIIAGLLFSIMLLFGLIYKTRKK